MEIIKYNQKYTKQVIDLIIDIQNEEYQLKLSLEEQPNLNDISKSYQSQGWNFWVAIENGEVIGTIGLLWENNNCAILKKIS